MNTIDVVFDPQVVDDRTLHVPTSMPDPPGRALLSPANDASKHVVVRMSPSRPGAQKAAAGAALLATLGTDGATGLACTYRAASIWTLLRYDTSAALDALLAVLGGISAAAAAWLTIDRAADTETGVAWVVSIMVFDVSLIVTMLKLRKELREVG